MTRDPFLKSCMYDKSEYGMYQVFLSISATKRGHNNIACLGHGGDGHDGHLGPKIGNHTTSVGRLSCDALGGALDSFIGFRGSATVHPSRLDYLDYRKVQSFTAGESAIST